jgi:3-hydroxyacyl-CoA dehydrogenase
MKRPIFKNVAVVGTGVIGRSWIQVFARAGCKVRVFDADPDQTAAAIDWLEADLKDLRKRGVIKKKEAKARRARVSAEETLADALEGVQYVQESLPENQEIKNRAYHELDALLDPNAIVGSSTSAMDMTLLAKGVPGARRFITAHPVNPPHLIPVVEVLRGAETDPKVLAKTIKFMTEVGQSPVVVQRFVPGFILNRMQAALVREAVDLVATGVADVEAVDTSIRDGLGLRWAFMGPFGVANTNADQGVRQYFTRYGGAYESMWDVLNTGTRFNEELIERLGEATDEMTGASYEGQRRWRDRMIAAIREVKRKDPLERDRPKRRKTTKARGKKSA